jgi:hypothetical protein
MIVQSPPRPQFSSYVFDNAEFWHRRLAETKRGNGYVVVELLHNNATVLMTDLHVARYVAEFLGCEVAAFIAPTFTSYPVPVVEVEQLARSFGITKFWHLCAASPRLRDSSTGAMKSSHDGADRSFASRMLTALRWRGLKDSALRRHVLDMEACGVPVGDLIYDSFLQMTRAPTISEVDPLFDEAIKQARSYLGQAETILRAEDVRALVVSNSAYVEYGGLLRLALKIGIPVYCKAWLQPVCIRRYDTFDEAKQSSDTPIQPALDFFREALGEKFARRASEFFPPSQQGNKFEPDLRYGYDSHKQELSGRAMRKKLGLDESAKICLIMAHQFNDSPHWYGDSLFDDYYQWLAHTLKFAATCSRLIWLVRQHPYEIALGEVGDFNRLVARYADIPHIKVVPQGITTSSFFDGVDAVTTVAGSAGLEFASAGVPPILAGNPFYGDLGFAVRPGTPTEYFAALQSVPALPRLSAAQMQQAKEAALVHFKYKRVGSSRLPPTKDLADQQVTQDDLDAYWVEASRRSKATSVESDPLYQNLRRMFLGREKTILDYLLTEPQPGQFSTG